MIAESGNSCKKWLTFDKFIGLVTMLLYIYTERRKFSCNLDIIIFQEFSRN